PHVEWRRYGHHPARILRVSTSGNFPSAIVWIRFLMSDVRAQRNHVTFGLQIEDGHVGIGTYASARRDWLVAVAPEGLGIDAGGVRPAAVHKIAVECVRHRMERVDVGDEAERRLRSAGREYVSNTEASQRINVFRMANRLSRL